MTLLGPVVYRSILPRLPKEILENAARAMAHAALPTCLACGESADPGVLVSSARAGSLEQVCPRCFYLRELDGLTRALPTSDSTRLLVEEGLRTLFEVVRTRATEVAEAGLGDGAQG